MGLLARIYDILEEDRQKEVSRLIKILILNFEALPSRARITKLRRLSNILKQHVDLINANVKMLERFERFE